MLTEKNQIMNLIAAHSSSTKNRIIMLLMMLAVLFNSCEKDKFNVPQNVGTIRFEANSYTIENNTVDPLTIVLPLSLPLEEAGTAVVTVDAQSTIAADQYTITPAIPAEGIKLNLEKGATEVSFQVSSLNNFEGEKTLILKLTSATGGLSIANIDATTTLTIKGNPILYPEIKPSVFDFAFGNVITTTISPSQSYIVSGVKLTADMTINASTNYQVSLDDNTFSSSLIVPLATINTAPVTVYARFAPNTGINQAVNGTITHSSAGIPDAVINLSGVEYGNATPGILLLNENFNYGTTASTLKAVSGSNWPVFSGSVNPVKYISSGLSFAGYGSSGVGGAVISENGSGSREDYSRSFATQSSGVVYAAQLVNIASAGATADFFGGLRDPAAGSSYFNRLNVKDDGGKPSIGIGKSSATVAYAGGTYSYGTTYLVVTKYDFSTGLSSLYVLNGAPSVIEPPTPDASTSAGSAPGALGNVIIRQSTNALTVTYDGIRIATSWKEAVGL